MPARIAQNFFQVKCLGCLSLGGPMGPGARQPASWSLVGGGVGWLHEPSTASYSAAARALDAGTTAARMGTHGSRSAPLTRGLLRGAVLRHILTN
jgi:hypothetical protein